MYLLGRTQMIPEAGYEEAVRRIMSVGFDGVEINIYDRSFRLREEFYHAGFAKTMKEILKRNGVTAFSVGAHMDYTAGREAFEKVRGALFVAAEIGAGAVIVTGAVKRAEEEFKAQWSRQLEALGKLCFGAEEEGVNLALEFEPGFVIDSTALMLEAFGEIRSPRLCVNADIGHMFLQDKEPLKSIEECGSRIVHAHLDNMKQGVHNHLVPYEGDMDMKAYLRALRSAGFDGTASLDVYQYDYEAVAPKSLAYLRGLLDGGQSTAQ